ncbi:hypothetical protein [Weissella paramesenteroides]|uniref:hypothetical protein n=1 Tax=Weissella paramesenteroides TaxID=1249 RepID=UPI00388F4F13
MIEQFSEADRFHVVNGTVGKVSYIDAFTKVEADRLLRDVVNIIQDVVNVNYKAAQSNPLGTEKNGTNGGVAVTTEAVPGVFVFKNVNLLNTK